MGKYHRIGSFANQNSIKMVNSNKVLKKMAFSFVFILNIRLKPLIPGSQKEKYFSTSATDYPGIIISNVEVCVIIISV